MDDTSDLNRLAAADPAGPDPDLSQLRARVLAAAATDVDHSPRRSGRFIAGGIAAAVALLAAGTLAGVALGRATADDPLLAIAEDSTDVPAVNTAPELPSIGTGPRTPAEAGAPIGPIGPVGPIGPMVATEDAASSSMIWPGYTEGFQPVPDLVNTPGVAPAYRLDGADINRAALAAQLAGTFDIANGSVGAAPDAADATITLGTDGAGMIWVYDDAMVSWSFSDSSRDPWVCVQPDDATGSSEPGSSEPGSSEPGPCEPRNPPPSENDARDQAEAILTSLGVDDAPGLQVGLDWDTFTDGAITTATAWQTLDGARTQLSWSISFDAQGPIWAHGFAAGLVSAGELPVIGARNAVLRSAEPRWRAFGPSPVDPMVLPMIEPSVEPLPRIDGDSPTAPDRSSSTGAITITWDPIIVTDAAATITQYWSSDGEFWLLPGYQLTTADDRGGWVVIAVAETAVTFTATR